MKTKIVVLSSLLKIVIGAILARTAVAEETGLGKPTADHLQTIAVGDLTVYALRMGQFEAKRSDLVRVPEDERPADYAETFGERRLFPFRTVVVDTGRCRILIDPCRADWMVGSKFECSNVRPGPDILVRLTELGIHPETITHVVMTHFHKDHASGFTVQRNGRWMPRFPKARYYLGRGDWEYRSVKTALAKPDSRIARTIGVVQKLGLLQLVDRQVDLVEGVRLIPAPGESPGHLIVRVRSGGQAFYYVGDLYHIPLEVEHPNWMASWNDPNSSLRSRREFTKAALSEDAIVLGSHLPLARLRRSSSGVVWEHADVDEGNQ